MNFNDVAIISVKGSYNTIHFWYMIKDDAINIMKNPNLNKKVDCYKLLNIYKTREETIYYKKTEKQY